MEFHSIDNLALFDTVEEVHGYTEHDRAQHGQAMVIWKLASSLLTYLFQQAQAACHDRRTSNLKKGYTMQGHMVCNQM